MGDRLREETGGQKAKEEARVRSSGERIRSELGPGGGDKEERVRAGGMGLGIIGLPGGRG